MAEYAMATTISVRKDGTGDFAVIQQALDVTADGDTVLIGPGEYIESTMVRLPGWTFDIESYMHLRSNNLTLIGAGPDVTVIGPTTYQGSAGAGSPAGASYSASGGFLQLSDLKIRNCYAGLYIVGELRMDRCSIVDTRRGISWDPTGPGGWVRNSVIEVAGAISDPRAFDIGGVGLGSGIELESCHFGAPAVIRGVQNMSMRDCYFTGLDLYSGTHLIVDTCRSIDGNNGISQTSGSGTYCEIRNTELKGRTVALYVSASAPGGRFVVENSRLEGGSYGVLWAAYSAGPCEIHHSDLIKGSGPIVRCESPGAAITHDLSNNYWGTTQLADIISWIIDHNDDLSIGATVLYTPFAGQSVPSETTTWGDLKALFR